MKLRSCILIYNDCYKANRKHKPAGIMIHDTSAGNASVGRYVQPKAPQPCDALLTPNKYNNDWNRTGVNKCTHAFIGLLSDGSVGTYQTLPFDIAGWHSGSGSKGKAKNANNTGYIGFEICDDGYKDREYFDKVYREAVEFTAFLCREYDIEVTKQTVIAHYEGHSLGIASNHSDVRVWFGKFGKTMEDFREDVKKQLNENAAEVAEKPKNVPKQFAVNDFVFFKGGNQYNNPSTDVPDKAVKEAFAVITKISGGARHPYHLRKADESGTIIGGLPYGYVDADTIQKADKALRKTFRVGDNVRFTGGPQYNNPKAAAADKIIKASSAKITKISEGAKHPYHIRKTDSNGKIIGGNPYGWVDKETIA